MDADALALQPAKTAGITAQPYASKDDMKQNLAFQHLSDEQWATVDQALAALETALAPALVALTPQQRRRAVKMGDGSQAFCRTAYDVARKNAGLLPRDFDLGEMGLDLASHDAVVERMVVLSNLMERVRDTDLALGSDAMVASLEAYAHLKVAGKAEGVDGLRKLLSKRFDGQGKKEAPAKV